MKLKQLAASAVLAVASAAASATVTNTVTNTFTVNLSALGEGAEGAYTAHVDNSVICAKGCDFIDTYYFLPDLDATANSTLATLGFGRFDIDFTAVSLNGQSYLVTPDFPLQDNTQTAILLDTIVSAPLTLVVAGHSGGTGRYTGTLNLKNAVAVPEPGTLALLGLAGISLAFAHRRKGASKALERTPSCA